jgi:hypothetical protein
MTLDRTHAPDCTNTHSVPFRCGSLGARFIDLRRVALRFMSVFSHADERPGQQLPAGTAQGISVVLKQAGIVQPRTELGYHHDGQHDTRLRALPRQARHRGADRLHASLAATFSTRERQPLPTVLPPPPASWARPYTSAAVDVGLPADLGTAHAEAATFLDPILAGTTAGRWNPAQNRWTIS